MSNIFFFSFQNFKDCNIQAYTQAAGFIIILIYIKEQAKIHIFLLWNTTVCIDLRISLWESKKYTRAKPGKFSYSIINIIHNTYTAVSDAIQRQTRQDILTTPRGFYNIEYILCFYVPKCAAGAPRRPYPRTPNCAHTPFVKFPRRIHIYIYIKAWRLYYCVSSGRCVFLLHAYDMQRPSRVRDLFH